MVLIKDNHIRLAGGIGAAVAAARHSVGPMVKVEVEVADLRQVEEALAAAADLIMLDNMSHEEMARAVRLINGRALVEASGGITLESLPRVAALGVDFVSMGALTHSYRSLDISLELDLAGEARGPCLREARWAPNWRCYWQAGEEGSAARVVALGAVSSTNDVARELARKGAPEGTLVVADRQSRGRGRLGRAWFSPPMGGLWCSVILRPPVPLCTLGPLALVAALGAAGAIERAAGLSCRIKWPNDLLAGGRKVGGILSESSGADPASPPEFVVVGIGINVNLARADFPPELQGVATSLAAEAGRQVSVAHLGLELVDQLEPVYRRFLSRGFGALRDDWIRASETIGRRVSVTGCGRTLAGLAETVDAEGRLILRLDDGTSEHVAAGDVSLRPDPGGLSCYWRST